MNIPENEENPFNLSAHLFQTLLDSTSHIHHFKGKWSLIRTKLADLKSQVADLSDSPTTNFLSPDLLPSISHTLSDAIFLSTTCQNPSTLPDGKLKTQNDVDSISARLDHHLNDTHVLIKSGLLQDALVVSTSSKRESVRIDARNLITRLQIGTLESRNAAMDSLLSLLQEDDKNVIITVAQGVVPVLVRLLDCSSSFEIKEKTVIAISRISAVDSSKNVLIAEGLVLVNNLLRVVESGSGFAKEKSCIALQSLTHSRENARAIRSRGGISSLLAICQAGTPSSQAVAAMVLRNLSEFEEIKDNFVDENAVPILLSLAASGTSLAQENAIGCLCNLVIDDFQLKLLIVREGGIESLKNYWDSAPAVKSLEVVVELLKILASLPPISEILVSNGFMNRLVSVLNCGVLGVRIAAAKAVSELGFNTKSLKEFGELGCIPPLVRMMEGKVGEERESAAKALSMLMGFGGNRRIFRKAEMGIVSAVQLLDHSTRNLDKKYPVSLLASLVHSKTCRKQMIDAGACVFLQKLVEMDVEGAEKLLDSLSKGKIWGIFPRP